MNFSAALLLLVIAAPSAYLLVGVLQWWRRKREGRMPLPHWSWPIVGEVFALFFVKVPEKTWLHRFDLYGSRTRLSLFGRELFLTAEPEDVKRVFAADGKETQAWLPDHIRLLFGKAIGTTVGAQHNVVRKALFTLFSTSVMRNYYGTMKYFVEKHVREWASTPGPHTMIDLLRLLTYETVYGCMINKEDATNKELLETVHVWFKAFISLPFNFPGSPLSKAFEARAKLRLTLQDLLNRTREERKNFTSEKQHTATVVLMLLRLAEELEEVGGEDGFLIDDITIIDNLINLLLAGHETVMTTLSSVMRILPEHPEVWRKIQQEVRSVVPDGADLTYDHIQNLPYCTAVVKEVLRYRPPVYVAFREAVQPMSFGPYTVLPGETIVTSYQGVHRLAFTDSECFDPDRFYRESEAYSTKYKNDDRNSFMSFAAGIRSCAGMKVSHFLLLTPFSVPLLSYFVPLSSPSLALSSCLVSLTQKR
ncbi:hypothetical protein QOT17_024194 [Balamuthia mandrillaris]